MVKPPHLFGDFTKYHLTIRRNQAFHGCITQHNHRPVCRYCVLACSLQIFNGYFSLFFIDVKCF